MKRYVKELIKGTRFEPAVVSLYEMILPKINRVGRQDSRYISQIIHYVLKQDSNCIDVGAHVGEIAGAFLECAPAGQHYAFEPIPEFAQFLRKQFPNLLVIESAVSDTSGEATFHHNISDPGYSGLLRRPYDRPPTRVDEITVKICRLDDVIPADLPIDFIKIDVEGGEYQVMQGGLRTIKAHQPYILFEHGSVGSPCYGASPAMVYDLLVRECGLRIFLLDGTGPLTEESMADVYERGNAWNFLAHR